MHLLGLGRPDQEREVNWGGKKVDFLPALLKNLSLIFRIKSSRLLRANCPVKQKGSDVTETITLDSWWSYKCVLAFLFLSLAAWWVVVSANLALRILPFSPACFAFFFIPNFLRGRFVCLVGEEVPIKDLNGRD